MKTHLNEPDDKALEGVNKVSNGCGLIIGGVAICIIFYSLWVLFSL